MDFFSEIQGFFKEEFSGRYFEIILKNIAIEEPSILEPLIGKRYKKLIRVDTEYQYKSGRKADLAFFLKNDKDEEEVILIEVKVNDSIIKAKTENSNDQLEDYLQWAKDQNNEEINFILLTAYPVEKKYQDEIAKINTKAEHIFISSMHGKLINKHTHNLTLIKLFLDYLIEKGYAMYDLNREENDLRALTSFLVLNFLIHESGHGRVKSKFNISSGPNIFSKLINNFQLISSRISSNNEFTPEANVMYMPEQVYSDSKRMTYEVDDKHSMIHHKMFNRKSRGNIGRYWISADYVLFEEQNVKIKLEWGQIIEIEEKEQTVRCILYAGLRNKNNFIYQRSHPLKDGISSKQLYSPELFTKEIQDLIDDCKIGLRENEEYGSFHDRIFVE